MRATLASGHVGGTLSVEDGGRCGRWLLAVAPKEAARGFLGIWCLWTALAFQQTDLLPPEDGCNYVLGLGHRCATAQHMRKQEVPTVRERLALGGSQSSLMGN